MRYSSKWTKYRLYFKRPAGTSRGTLHFKDSWFIQLKNSATDSYYGIGECGMLRGLSYDDRPDYEEMLDHLCLALNLGKPLPDLTDFPSIRFGLEMALLDLQNQGRKILFEGDFTQGKKGIPINGLIWMGSKEDMLCQIEEKIKMEYRCIKIKIGALNFEDEISVIQHIRKHFSSKEITIRLDANGAFEKNEALEKLNRLAEFEIHSIEQPIRAGLNESLAQLSIDSPIPIALDESLIPLQTLAQKSALLHFIRPQYIILKPSFLGGIEGTEQWIRIAEELKIHWWITSALESNIGLNAIAQWTGTHNVSLEQGLGTGQLYENNIPSPLKIKGGQLWSKNNDIWHEHLFA